MFSKLMFIDDALNSVYNIETASCHKFAGETESPNIQDSDYKILIDYFEHQNKLDLKVLIGSLNLLAYGHIQNRETLIDYIKKFSKQIFSELDVIVPNIADSFNKRIEEYYKSIINSDFSYNLLKNIDVEHHQILTTNHYGLRYLLLWMTEYCYFDFEEWYINTSREDLKIYFTYISMYQCRLFFSKNNFYVNSKINWLKAFYILSKYKIARFIPLGDEDFHSIINLPLTDKEKLDLIVYYFFNTYNSFDYNFENPEQLEKDLKLFENIEWEEFFDINYIENLDLWLSKYHILFIIISHIKDRRKQLSLYDYILVKLETYLQQEHITSHELALANVYGTILLDYDDNAVSKIEEKYKVITKILSKPYTFHRKKEQWKINICKLLFYTIALYIAKHTDKDFCKKLIDNFENTKNNLPHYLDNDINSLLEQLQNKLDK